MRGVSVLAIVVGGVCDVVLSGLLGAGLVLYVMFSRGLPRLPKEQLQSTLIAMIHSTPGLYITQLAIGLGCSILGGFIAASIAKHRRVLNGVLAAWLCVGLGIYT